MNNSLKEVKHSLTKKLFIGLALIGVTVGIVLALTSYYYTKQYIFEITSKLTDSCAIDVANMMYDAPIDKFLRGEEQELYKSHLRSVKNIANTFGLKYLYVYIPDEKNNKIISIIGVEGETGKIISEFELGNSPKKLKPRSEILNMYKNKDNGLTIQINNEYGHVLSGYATIIDKNKNPIAVAGADVDFGRIMHDLRQSFLWTFVEIILTLLLILVLVLQYIKRTFIKPILQLSNEMKNAMDTNTQYKPIDLNTNDEFNTIAGMYNMVSKEQKRMSSELLIARTIQLSSLPSKFPAYPEHNEFDIYATMVPAKEVGGDFYDFFFIDENKFMFLIADVSGKGIPAALFMMTTKTLIKSIAVENLPPKEMINKINKQVCGNNEQGFFVTLFGVITDIKTGKTSLINCGHNPPLLKRNNGKYEYLNIKSNLVLGIVNDFDYNIEEITLSKDDILFLYTDGVTEALNENNELYGEQRLIDTLNTTKNNNSILLNEILANTDNDLKKFINDTEQSDDITMLAFKYNGIQ